LRVFRLFSNVTDSVDATFKQIEIYINGNFSKVIKLLIAIYGKHCIVCDYVSPEFRKDSGVAEHYYSRHRKETVVFVRDNILTKSVDEIGELLQ
jgi:hypothetical protein